MEQIVTGCKDCPLFYTDTFSGIDFCNHPLVIDKLDSDIKHENNVLITPDWCPLKKEPISISISNEQTK